MSFYKQIRRTNIKRDQDKQIKLLDHYYHRKEIKIFLHYTQNLMGGGVDEDEETSRILNYFDIYQRGGEKGWIDVP